MIVCFPLFPAIRGRIKNLKHVTIMFQPACMIDLYHQEQHCMCAPSYGKNYYSPNISLVLLSMSRQAFACGFGLLVWEGYFFKHSQNVERYFIFVYIDLICQLNLSKANYLLLKYLLRNCIFHYHFHLSLTLFFKFKFGKGHHLFLDMSQHIFGVLSQ